jgi:hypothetical protein
MARKKCSRGKVHGYLRCEPGKAGKRSTRRERRAKVCHRGGHKLGVSQHRREICRKSR